MLSVVILTKNEEKNIVDCLETVLWADEIIIIDDYSEDRTLEIVKNLNNKKIKIYKNSLDNDFSKQRNFGLTKATKKWVFFVDADERVSKELREEINSIIVNSYGKNNGYFIKRRDYIWGKMLKHGETGSISLLRFAKRGSGIWMGKVHEVWNVEGNIDSLNSILLHFPHQTINEFLREINTYSTISAKEMIDKKIKVSMFDIFIYPKGKFLLNYFFKLGFLDGIEGLIFAIMMSFHSFLVRGKLWMLWQKKYSSSYS